jgi:hypothetical protein
LALNGNQIELTKRCCKQPSKSTIAGKACVTKSTIHDRRLDPPSMSFVNQVGPKFKLNEYQHFRLPTVEGSPYGPGEVERCEADKVIRKPRSRQFETRLAGRRNQERSIGPMPTQGSDHRYQYVDFTHADGMKPDSTAPVSDRHLATKLFGPTSLIFFVPNAAVQQQRRGQQRQAEVAEIENESHGKSLPIVK